MRVITLEYLVDIGKERADQFIGSEEDCDTWVAKRAAEFYELKSCECNVFKTMGTKFEHEKSFKLTSENGDRIIFCYIDEGQPLKGE